jgi:hypothetical protein
MKKKILTSILCIGMLLTIFSTLGAPLSSATRPRAPSDPYPADGSTGVTIYIDVRWTKGDTTGTEMTYDVYFGSENPPHLVMHNQSDTTYDPGTLVFDTTYYWKIIIWDGQTHTEGPIWSFTTAPDQPPFQPQIVSGPTAAGTGIALNFTAIAPDPEGDQVSYQWDWGDGNTSEWLGPFAFGERAKATYQWITNGDYDIKVKAKDTQGKESSWSLVRHLSIAPQIEIANLKQGFLYFNIFGYDQAYGYIASLDYLEMAMILSTGGFTVNATVSNAVHSVVFTMSKMILTDEQYTTTDDNMSDDCTGYFTLTPGFYQTTVSAFDADGNLIDQHTRDTILYLQINFSLKSFLSRFHLRSK